MKIYEKPMAIVNKFEVADVIAASVVKNSEVDTFVDTTKVSGVDNTTQGVLFVW